MAGTSQGVRFCTVNLGQGQRVHELGAPALALVRASGWTNWLIAGAMCSVWRPARTPALRTAADTHALALAVTSALCSESLHGSRSFAAGDAFLTGTPSTGEPRGLLGWRT